MGALSNLVALMATAAAAAAAACCSCCLLIFGPTGNGAATSVRFHTRGEHSVVIKQRLGELEGNPDPELLLWHTDMWQET